MWLCAPISGLGPQKGALPKFIEDAVKWRFFDQTVNEVRQAWADVPAEELHMIDEAVVSVRKEKHRERQECSSNPGV